MVLAVYLVSDRRSFSHVYRRRISTNPDTGWGAPREASLDHWNSTRHFKSVFNEWLEITVSENCLSRLRINVGFTVRSEREQEGQRHRSSVSVIIAIEFGPDIERFDVTRATPSAVSHLDRLGNLVSKQ